MQAPLVLTFISTVAFAIQLLIFAYLYSSHRVRFFQYLLLAWSAYTLSKGLGLVDGLVLSAQHPSVATDLATVAAVGFTLAASFAHRWGLSTAGTGRPGGALASRCALERFGRNHSGAAEALGIGRTTRWRKLKEYGHDR